jgi:aminomethyltransferase
VEQPIPTPLSDWHRQHGAKMVPFAGFDMPVQYTSILAEHEHTRTKAAIYDICHMGEFHLSGQGAAAALSAIVTHDLDTLAPGKCRYGFLCNEAGGVIDDLIVYCLDTDSYMLVVNAARMPSISIGSRPGCRKDSFLPTTPRPRPRSTSRARWLMRSCATGARRLQPA